MSICSKVRLLSDNVQKMSESTDFKRMFNSTLLSVNIEISNQIFSNGIVLFFIVLCFSWVVDLGWVEISVKFCVN